MGIQKHTRNYQWLASACLAVFCFLGAAYGCNFAGNYIAQLLSLNESIRLEPGATEFYFRRAAVYYSLADYGGLKKPVAITKEEAFTKSLADLNRGLRIDPAARASRNGVSYRMLRANIYFIREDYGKAAADYTEMINAGPENMNYVFFRGALYFLLGDYGKAAADFAAARDVKYGGIALGLARERHKTGVSRGAAADAERHYIRALARANVKDEWKSVRAGFPEDGWEDPGWDNSYKIPRDTDFEAAMKLAPDSEEYRHAYGMARREDRNDVPNAAKYHMDRGYNLHLKSGDTAAAIADFAEAVRLGLNPSYIRDDIKYSGLTAVYANLIRRYPDVADYYVWTADIIERERENFIIELERKIFNPEHRHACVSSGDTAACYENEKKYYDDIIAVYTEAVRSVPDKDKARLLDMRGKARFAKGDTATAVADHVEAALLRPSRVVGWKSYEYNALLFDELIRRFPNAADYYAYRGAAQFHKNTEADIEGKYLVYRSKNGDDKTLADYHKAIRLKPSEPAYYAMRGEAYLKLGLQEKSDTDLARAKRLKPDGLFYFSLGGCYFGE